MVKEHLIGGYRLSQKTENFYHIQTESVKKLVHSDDFTTENRSCIMSVEETALFFGKSTSWVYKNWKKLGGRKLGGSLFFPNKEDLYDAVFQKGKGVEVRLHPGRNQVHRPMVRDKERSEKRRRKKTEGGGGTTRRDNDPNRYGLLDLD